MPNRINPNGFVADLVRHIGQTVTIFTTSGGESGDGFTGVLVSVNCNFVRLITQIGPAPGCALGNCCDERRDNTGNINTGFEEDNNTGNVGEFDNQINFLGGTNNNNRTNRGTDRETNRQRRIICNGSTLGSVVDIPIDSIAAFVHNAVGSGW